MKHVAIYMRVSSAQQRHASQLPSLTRFADAQDEPVKWYEDKFTGKTMDRPGWNKLQADLTAAKVSKIVVWKLDRLGRTTIGLCQLFTELMERKVALLSLTEGIDLSTPAGRKFARDLASAAEYETEVRGERVREGQAVARANGKSWGGSEKGRLLKVTKEQLAIVARLHREGENPTQIHKATGLSRTTVYRLLERLKEMR